MKKVLFSCFGLAILAVSCSKNDPAPANPASSKFMTLTAGSTWNYETIDNITPGTTSYTVTSTTRDTTINGKVYHVFTNSNGNTSEYYNITDNSYYNYAELTAPLDPIEFLYLKDNVAAGGSWSQSVPVTVPGLPFPLTATVTNTVEEKGGSKVVNGITYTNVIKVKTDISVAGIPASAITTNIHSYYAPKYGQIRTESAIDINYGGVVNNSNTTTNLLSSNIP